MTQAQYAKTANSSVQAIAALKASDSKLATWISRIGPISVPKAQRFSLVNALARSILYQQLSGKAAETIIGRLEVLAGESEFSPGTLARLSDAEFRSVGVSGNKAKALKSLADHALAGALPGPRQITKMPNQTLIDTLLPIRGVGRWTVEMLLMFRLGRTDVLPVDDLGVRNGAKLVHELPEMPKPKALAALGEQFWAPHYTLASLYLWRVVELAKHDAKNPEPAP